MPFENTYQSYEFLSLLYLLCYVSETFCGMSLLDLAENTHLQTSMCEAGANTSHVWRGFSVQSASHTYTGNVRTAILAYSLFSVNRCNYLLMDQCLVLQHRQRSKRISTWAISAYNKQTAGIFALSLN